MAGKASKRSALNVIQEDNLPVYIDGKEWKINAEDLSRSHSLSEFIHARRGTGRKACGEGGCGACSVIVTRPVVDSSDTPIVSLERYSVASCITPIGDLAYCSVTTPKGCTTIAEARMTPAQQAIVVTNAAQCGFCTGGIVSVLDSECSGKGRSCEDVESLLDGNLCRCTGYRSISEAAQMLCDDYQGSYQEQASKIRSLALDYRRQAEDQANFPASLLTAFEQVFCNPDVDGIALVERDLDPQTNEESGERDAFASLPHLQGERLLSSHIRPNSLDALIALYGEAPEATRVQAAGGATRWEGRILAAGFTDAAYEEHRTHSFFRHTLSVRDVPELRHWGLREDGALEIGSAVSIGSLRKIRDTLRRESPAYESQRVALTALTTQARFFANENVRHTGSVGGGLVSCHHLSDMVPVWIALNAEVKLASQSSGERTVPVRELVDSKAGKLSLHVDEVLVALVLRPRAPQEFIAETFKQAIRRTDSMTLVSAAISANRDHDGKLSDVCVALAGLGTPGLRAHRLEAELEGKTFNSELVDAGYLESLLQLAKAEISEINCRQLPSVMTEYQSEVAAAFVRRFLHMSSRQADSYEDSQRFQQPPCRGEQLFSEEVVSGSIVGHAIPHQYIAQHAQSNTQYAVDAQLPENGLWAAIVTAPVASGLLDSIDASGCREVSEFVAIYTADDIPGSNMQGHMVHPLEEEEILCSKEVCYFGQPVAIVVAHTQPAAEQAAARVRVKVSSQQVPILSFDDIRERESYFSFEHHEGNPQQEPRQRQLKRGNPEAVFAQASADQDNYLIHEGRVEAGGQACFYLEPQCAVAYPQGESGMRVLSSTQSPAHVARYVASALGVPEHQVEVVAGFVGGGFGGKQTRSASFAAMAAVAARCAEVPVKLVLTRELDMTLVPGRSPFRADYRLAVERETGRIAALDIDMLANGGAAEDYSPSITETAVFLIDNAYYLEHADIRARCGRSNLPAGFTATRGYGKPQAGALIESILDEVSALLDIDPQLLRQRNLYSYGQSALADSPIDDDVLRACWRSAVDQNYQSWRAECTEFNASHSHVKRGLAAVPSKGNMGFLEAVDINRGAAIVRVHSDGSVRLSHSGVEMGQGINTRMMQVAAQALGVPIDRVLVDTTRTSDLPNTPPTTMVATDMVGASILQACDQLLEVLAEVGYPEQRSFSEAAHQCYIDGRSLQARGFAQEPRLRFDWLQQQGHVSYFYVWGAALSEVEVDAGTGSWRIVRTHITQDCGRSLNPMLDIGQAEGGFAFGLGYSLLEKMIYLDDGSLLTNNVSSYKIPSIDDMPRNWTVEILQETEGPPGRRGLHNSKGVGEANIQLGYSAYFAVKDAIRSIRRDKGLQPNDFKLPFPAMAYDILLACK